MQKAALLWWRPMAGAFVCECCDLRTTLTALRVQLICANAITEAGVWLVRRQCEQAQWRCRDGGHDERRDDGVQGWR